MLHFSEQSDQHSSQPLADLTVFLVNLSTFLTSRQLMLNTAESCTGGLIAAACTELAGSSAWFDRGFVTYSNAAKTELLGVDSVLIEQHGAVSEPVAQAMAWGAANSSAAPSRPRPVSLAVTGIAGPGGGSADKPVGTVWFGFCVNGQLHSEKCQFQGDRSRIRAQTVAHALQRLLQLLQSYDFQ